MASYTPKQYAAQRRITIIIGESNRLQRCPICKQPQGMWPDGQRRITCGRDACYRKWLSFRPETHKNDD